MENSQKGFIINQAPLDTTLPFTKSLFSYFTKGGPNNLSKNSSLDTFQDPTNNTFQKELSINLNAPVLVLSNKTRHPTLQTIHETQNILWHILPYSSHFNYETTGQLARFFSENLENIHLEKLFYIKSYSHTPHYVFLFQKQIQKTLSLYKIKEQETILLFYAEGLEKNKQRQNTLYFYETYHSFKQIRKGFPYVEGILAFSKEALTKEAFFKEEEKIFPSLLDHVHFFYKEKDKRKNILLIPFTSIFSPPLEIEKELLTFLDGQGYTLHFMPPFEKDLFFQKSIINIMKTEGYANTQMLLPKS